MRSTAAGRSPAVARRSGLLLAAAVAGAVLGNVLLADDPAAQADPEPVSVAEQLGLAAGSTPAPATPDLAPLEQLAASRSTREAAETAAAQVQAAADQAVLDQQAAEAEAARVAAAAAAAEAAAQQAAEQAAQQAAAAAAKAPSRNGQPSSSSGTLADVVARITNTSGPVKPQVQAAANAVVSNVPGADEITLGGTRPSATDPHGHPSGLALDYMVLSDEALGDAIAQYQIDHWDELGVEYVIWQQRMLSSPNGSWRPMEDRGSPTENHMDHVHVNYRG